MASTVRRTTGTVALAAIALAATGGLYVAWKRFGGVDPYGGLKPKASMGPAVVVNGATMKRYENGKPTISAQADRLVVNRDHATIGLTHVKNGVANTAQGPVQFAGGMALVNPSQRTVDLSGGIRVKGGDFDLTSSQARLNGRIGEISVPAPLQGTLKGGVFSAQGLFHRSNSNLTRLDAPTWKGKPPAELVSSVGQAGGVIDKDRTWHFTGDTVIQKGNVVTAKDGWASDEQMVVTAPTMVSNTETKVVTATSNGKVRVTYHSAKADIVADQVVIYRNEHKAVCTGHVLVYVRPKKEWDKPVDYEHEVSGPIVPDIPPALVAKIGQGGKLSDSEQQKVDELRSTKNLRDFPMQLSADEVTYWYKEGERHAIAKNGNPTAFQRFDDGRWRQVWAPEAHYDGEKDLLDLIGGTSKREVHLRNSLDEITDCYNAKMSTKEDEKAEDEYMEMKSPKGHMIDFSDDVPRDKGGTASPPPKAAGTKPAGSGDKPGTPPTKPKTGG